MENSKEKLKLDYPCNWEYKAICESHHDISQIASDVLDKKEHTIKQSNNSKGGKYTSHTITTLVNSDDERKAIYEELKKHKSIKFVL
ncbi:DUF493 domain-containing protein [Sulfurospirillum sp. 1307]